MHLTLASSAHLLSSVHATRRVGLPLLALATALSTYLGLMATRGLGWLESLLSIGAADILTAVAMIAVRGEDSLATAVALGVFLACLAVALRFIAQRSWSEIDWTLCRPDRVATARPAA